MSVQLHRVFEGRFLDRKRHHHLRQLCIPIAATGTLFKQRRAERSAPMRTLVSSAARNASVAMVQISSSPTLCSGLVDSITE